MNYREQQFRQLIRSFYIPKRNWQSLELEKTLLEGDLEALRTSLDYGNLAHWERENQALKTELTNLQAFSEEQHNLINSQENTIQEQKVIIQGLTTDLQHKNNLLTQKNTLLRQFLAAKQEQLTHYD